MSILSRRALATVVHRHVVAASGLAAEHATVNAVAGTYGVTPERVRSAVSDEVTKARLERLVDLDGTSWLRRPERDAA